MLKANRKYLFFLVFLLLFLFSCKNGSSPINNENTTETTVNFEETTNEFIRYFTNDTDKYTRNYIHTIPDADQYPFVEMSVELKKDSGYALGDYGVVFGYEDENNYYLLSIDVEGNYSIKVMKFGILKTIQDWADDIDTSLISGYSQLNKLRIVKESTSNTYEIYFNEDQVCQTSFMTDSIIEGSIGFFVYIGSIQVENFPSEPVDVSFRLILSDSE